MKWLLTLITLTLLPGCSLLSSKDDTFKVVHWNIKELETKKIDKDNEQFKAVESILNSLEFNILDVNEIQFDRKFIPNYRYRTTGQNAQNLLTLLGKEPMEHAISFYESNTGQKARKTKGSYETHLTRQTRNKADQDNFGLYPGQYSTAVLSSYPIKEELIIKDLKWKAFNKDIKLSRYRRENGDKLPNNIQLFDKGFSDVVIEINDKEVHFISLHAVPAYHFGNRKTPNFDRNRDQLRFLEWYLTGGTDIAIKLPKKYEHIKPLPKDAIYIATGDFNASIDDNNPGSIVLRRLFKNTKLWMEKIPHTHEQQHFGKERLKLTLDYMLYQNLKVMDSGVYYPDENSGVCIKAKDLPRDLKPRREKLEDDQCISEKSIELKRASDHFPIWAVFKL